MLLPKARRYLEKIGSSIASLDTENTVVLDLSVLPAATDFDC